MFQDYISFLGWPSTIYVIPVAIGVAAATLMWIANRKSAQAVGLAVVVSVGVYLLHLLSSFCLQVSVPMWWPTLCVVVGWIVGIVFFCALVDEDGSFIGAIIMGFIARYALQWVLGPFVIFPLLKYVVGYFVYMLAPAALLVLWVIVVVKLLRPSAGLRWLLIPFLYFICLTVFLLAIPVLMEDPKTYFGDALTAVAPCALAIVVLGIKRSFKILLFCMAFLYSWGAALLLRSLRVEPAENQIGLSLLSPPVVWGFCLVLVGLVANHIYHLIKHDQSGIKETPLWVVVMPWVSLVPAFYFAKLGIGWFLLFASANVLIGLVLIAWFAFQFGSLGFVSREVGRGIGPIGKQARIRQTRLHDYRSQTSGIGPIGKRARFRWFSSSGKR